MNNAIRKTYRITQELAAAVDAEAKATDRSRSAIVRIALRQYFERQVREWRERQPEEKGEK